MEWRPATDAEIVKINFMGTTLPGGPLFRTHLTYRLKPSNILDVKFSSPTYRQLKAALQEDLGSGDRTSNLLIPTGASVQAHVIAKGSGVFCGTEAAQFLSKIQDSGIRLHFEIREGESFQRGKSLGSLKGNLRVILVVERTMLNLLGRLCGIATLTHQFVQKVKPYGVKILDTRKTTPLWRELEKYAVKTGGGYNHRMGLYDEIFVKENHRIFSDLKKLKNHRRKFVIEVRDQKEIEEALPLKPRVMLFDNFSVRDLKQAVQFVRRRDSRIKLEASGGMTLHNIVSYARTGVDQISIGALTHSVPAIDLSLLIEGKK